MMDDIIQRLQVETVKAQLSLLQLGRAYLAGRSSSPDAMDPEAVALFQRMEVSRKETGALQGELKLLQGRVKPIWG
jgi:hypothetical protein